MTRKAQMEAELAVFREFSGVCPIEILADSIESRIPQEPDIRCVMTGQAVAFELVELVDPSAIETISLQRGTQEYLEDAYRNLSVDSHEQFDVRYRRSMLSFDFAPDAGLTKRKKVIDKAFDILISFRQSLHEFCIKHDSDLMPVLRGVRVKRSSVNGPSFHVSGYGHMNDPTFDTISAKFCKKYRTDAPVELLAYVCWDLLPSRDEILDAAKKACLDIQNSPFRRVWIFDCIRREIIFVSPAAET